MLHFCTRFTEMVLKNDFKRNISVAEIDIMFFLHLCNGSVACNNMQHSAVSIIIFFTLGIKDPEGFGKN